jgi:hypothetical protein
MIKKALILCFLVCSLMFIGNVKALDDGVDSYINQDEFDAIPTPTPYPGYFNLSVVQSINPQGVPVTFPMFAPAIVTLNYAEAQNYFVNFSSYDTQHRESQSATSMSVELYGVGTYQFSFNVRYSQLVNQTVTLLFTSGANNTFPMSFPISICNKGFVLDVVIVTSEEPHFPSADEIADATYNQQRELIESMSRETKDSQAFTNIAIAVISGIIVAVVVVLAVVVFWARRTDRRQISQQYRGLGYGGSR